MTDPIEPTAGTRDRIGAKARRCARNRALDDVLEADFQNQVLELAELCRFERRYHTHRSDRSTKGFPDLVLVSRGRGRLIFAELKRQTTELTDEQVAWCDDLDAVGAEVYVWRPEDLERIGKILSGDRLTA